MPGFAVDQRGRTWAATTMKSLKNLSSGAIAWLVGSRDCKSVSANWQQALMRTWYEPIGEDFELRLA